MFWMAIIRIYRDTKMNYVACKRSFAMHFAYAALFQMYLNKHIYPRIYKIHIIKYHIH